MTVYTHDVKRKIIPPVIIGVLCLVASVFLPYGTFWTALAFGLAIGVVNQVYTAVKVQQIVDNVMQGKRSPYRIGMLTRFSLAALGALLVIRFPQHFSLSGYAIGLAIPIVFALFDAIYASLRKERNSEERGE